MRFTPKAFRCHSSRESYLRQWVTGGARQKSMYIPEFNRVEDRNKAIAFMRANPFAILVSVNEKVPFATHLPVVISEIDGQLTVRAHVAKANPHWQLIEKQESLLIFHGPHAYISPSLYEIRESVPTWNYATVHVYGKGRIVSDEAGATRVLEDLIAQFDESYREQWNSLSADYRTRMLRHIVAFEICASRIQAKFKLSQNRTKPEQENVIRALSGNPDSAIAGTATLMRGEGLGDRK
jgi:transcriptional regulator